MESIAQVRRIIVQILLKFFLKRSVEEYIYVLGIGYPEYIQVSPNFNNYFGQPAMNSGLRKGYRFSQGTGTCESEYT